MHSERLPENVPNAKSNAAVNSTIETFDVRSIFLLSTIPKSINKNFIVLDCNWANCAAKFKCTLNTIEN